MLVVGGVLAAALAVVGFAVAWLVDGRNLSRGQSLGIVAAALWVTAMAVVWSLHEEPRGRSVPVRSLDSLAWPGGSQLDGGANSFPRSVAPAPAPGVQAASVESLVGGLELRLSAQPDDAEGWALLAQSYAYTANEEAVERAVQRAVALGADEAALRERVAEAKRSAHPVDWIDRAIGARRP